MANDLEAAALATVVTDAVAAIGVVAKATDDEAVAVAAVVAIGVVVRATAAVAAIVTHAMTNQWFACSGGYCSGCGIGCCDDVSIGGYGGCSTGRCCDSCSSGCRDVQ